MRPEDIEKMDGWDRVARVARLLKVEMDSFCATNGVDIEMEVKRQEPINILIRPRPKTICLTLTTLNDEPI